MGSFADRRVVVVASEIFRGRGRNKRAKRLFQTAKQGQRDEFCGPWMWSGSKRVKVLFSLGSTGSLLPPAVPPR